MSGIRPIRGSRGGGLAAAVALGSMGLALVLPGAPVAVAEATPVAAADHGATAAAKCAAARQPANAPVLLRIALTECFRWYGNRMQVGGRQLDRGTVLQRLHEEPDAARRRALFDAFRPLWTALDGEGGAESPYRRLLVLEREAARPGDLPVERAARQLGITPDQLETWLEQVLAAWRETLPDTPVEPWDYRYLNSYANRELQSAIPAAELLAITKRYFRDLGADPDELEVRYELAGSPGQSPLAYTDIRRPGARLPDGRWQRPAAVVVGHYPEGGLFSLNELVHETGHAVHVAALRPATGKTDWPDTLFVEAFADVPSWSTYEPAWQQRYLGRAAPEALTQRALLSDVMLDLAWALFEIRLLRDPAQDPDLVWTELTSRYLNIRPHPEVPWWAQRVQLVEEPGYMLNYGLGALVTAELRAAVRTAVGDFHGPNPGWYGWLEERLLRHGPERSVRELLEAVLGRPLGAEALLAQVRRIGKPPAPLQLRVMSFNVWYGGDQVSLAATAETLRRSDADIIGIQEPEGHLATLAAMAGYPYIDLRRNLLSRFPLFDSGNGTRDTPGQPPSGITALDADELHAWVMVRPGEIVAVGNTHLPSDLYGPEAVRDGAAPATVLGLEDEARMPSAQALLPLATVARDGTPVFLTGDFNTPSHRDWTPAMQALRPEAVKYPVDWPVSKALELAGFRDSFREVHPDPRLRPGLTWTAGMPAPYLRPRETLDRIDFIWTAGTARAIDSRIFGEPGGNDVDESVFPWPSDHRALVSTFEVIPMTASALVAVEPAVIRIGEQLRVRAHDPASEGWSIVVVPADGAAAGPAARPLLAAREEVTAWRRFARFATTGMNAGEYDAVLLDTAGGELRRTRFALIDGQSPPRLEKVASPQRIGQPLIVHWHNMPGHRFDWVGLFRIDDSMRSAAPILPEVQRYLQARTTGKLELPTLKNGKPLQAGLYEVRLMLDDSSTVLASTKVRLH